MKKKDTLRTMENSRFLSLVRTAGVIPTRHRYIGYVLLLMSADFVGENGGGGGYLVYTTAPKKRTIVCCKIFLKKKKALSPQARGRGHDKPGFASKKNAQWLCD